MLVSYIDDLRHRIRKMTRKSILYWALKEELTAQGYWKLKARGKPRDDIQGG